MHTPYPLRTKPFFRDYIWGGRNLESTLGKAIPAEGKWAESWEIVDHPEHQSEVTNGELAGQSLKQITSEHREWLLGGTATESLPLLLKYLDCQRVLSVQVHPDDEYGLKMTTPDLGKTEAWYIIEAEPGAKLYAGLKSGTSKESLQAAVEAGEVEDVLHTIEPKAGDCVFIPAGTVHALGAGLLVAEIQQASNTTFRLFDWNRLGNDGQPRPLHVEQALEVIDFDSGPRALQEPTSTAEPGRSRLVECEKFTLDRLEQESDFKLGGDGKFHFVTAPKGGVTLSWNDSNGSHTEDLKQGESVMLPAAMPEVQCNLQADVFALDMYV